MEIKYENKYVAFIDVLGFSDLVFKDKPKVQEFFNAIDEAFNYFSITEEIEKISISDSIIFLAADNDSDFVTLLKMVQNLQGNLASNNIWVRGGITFGEVSFNDKKNIIVGEGFINSYKLEKQAIQPRIIIDPRIVKKLNCSLKEFQVKINPVLGEGAFNYTIIYDGTNSDYFEDVIFINYADRILIESLFYLKTIPIGDTMMDKVYEHLKLNLYGSQQHYSKYLWVKKYLQKVILDNLLLSNQPEHLNYKYKAAFNYWEKKFSSL